MIWIRVVKLKDLPKLIELNLIDKDSKIDNNNYIMVCEDDEKPAATASLKISKDTGLIHSINILDEFKDQFLEDALVRSLINLASNRAVFNLYFNSNQTKLINIFKRIGFVELKDKTFDCNFIKDIDQNMTLLFLDINEFFANQKC